MAYDLEEQEQLASLKAWWNQYGNLLSWLLIIVLGAYAGWNGWNYYQRSQSAQASALYDEMQKMVLAKDGAKTLRLASDIQARYASSSYASMSALVAAKTAFEANDLKNTKAQLEWVVAHGSAEYQAIAKLRLAGVLLDEKAFDAALKLLAGEFLPQFAGSVADRRGDVLVAQNKTAEARAVYQAALAAMDGNNPGRQLVQAKLDAIGGAARAPNAA